MPAKKPAKKPANTEPFDNDPNIGFGKRKFRVVVGEWRYRAEFTVEIGGNCRGLDLFDSAVETAWEQLPAVEGYDDLRVLKMTNASGGTLIADDCDEHDFKRLVVCVELVGVTKDRD